MLSPTKRKEPPPVSSGSFRFRRVRVTRSIRIGSLEKGGSGNLEGKQEPAASLLVLLCLYYTRRVPAMTNQILFPGRKKIGSMLFVSMEKSKTKAGFSNSSQRTGKNRLIFDFHETVPAGGSGSKKGPVAFILLPEAPDGRLLQPAPLSAALPFGPVLSAGPR